MRSSVSTSTILLTISTWMTFGIGIQCGYDLVAADNSDDSRTIRLYVSQKGDDRWSGLVREPTANDGPLATIERARTAVREMRKREKNLPLVRVIIGPGTYYLEQPLDFGAEDSGRLDAPVIYSAATEGTVVLSGGRRLDRATSKTANGRIAWCFDGPGLSESNWRFRQLFINGVRCPRTRLPKKGEYTIQSLPGYSGDFLRSPTKQFVFADGDFNPNWRNLHDIEVVGITRWLDNRLPIERVDAATRTVVFDRPSLFALLANDRPGPYWIENVFEALDEPGQWYFDRPNHVVYYLPRQGDEMATADVIAPRLSQLLRVNGRPNAPVHDLQFEGLTFSHSEWQLPADYASSLQAGIEVPGAVVFDYAERCALTDGRIEHIGTYAVEVGVGCVDIEIARNRITDIGAGGIRVGHFFSWETDGSGQLTERGRQRKAAMPSGPHSHQITIADNVIADCGHLTHEAVGIFIGDNANNKIVHNHVHHMDYTGISVGSVQDFHTGQASGNRIEFNLVHDVGRGMLSDLAGIYTCSTTDTQIQFNIIHDVSRRDYGGWGIYPDEGSHDLLIRSNLVYRCQDGGLFAHHNRDITVENNVFAMNGSAQIERGGIGGFELTFTKNVVYYSDGKAIGGYGGENFGREVCRFDSNLYWNSSGRPVLFGNKDFEGWQARGQDKKGVIADPLMIDPTKSDFRLRADSPAKLIGFESWDTSTVGPRSDAREISR